MALPIDHSAPDTAPEAAADVFGADGAALVISEAGANPAGIVVAAAGDGLKADLTVLGLEDLLGLRLNEDDDTARSADSSAGLARLLGIADLYQRQKRLTHKTLPRRGAAVIRFSAMVTLRRIADVCSSETAR